MSVLDNLEPKAVFHWFEEIAAIPHGSGNIRAISDYLVNFAKDRELPVTQDEMGNVIITCPASAGYEDRPTVILQGHMDMVSEKTPDCTIDMEKEGLKLVTDGETVTAEGTTLGGDDGIALAYGLAILDADDIPHPPLEVIFTVDEEIGMLGAAGLQHTDKLKGRYLLNIDMENEGEIVCGCAGGILVTGFFPLEWQEYQPSTPGEKLCRVIIDGLKGGHSGDEIDKGRGNAHVMLGRVLGKLFRDDACRLVRVEGGLRDNVIPGRAEAVFYGPSAEAEEKVRQCQSIFQNELRLTDPDVSVRMEEIEQTEEVTSVMTQESSDWIIRALRLLPNGVQRMSFDTPGLVQTSLNMGVLRMEAESSRDGFTSDESRAKELKIGFCLRSSVPSEKEELIGRVRLMIRTLGGTPSSEGDYPGWEYRKDSALREHMVSVYEKMFGHKPRVTSIHAGLEGGYFCEKIPGLDAVSFGPDIRDIHTPAETMDVASVKRMWNYLLAVLKEPIRAE